MLSCRDFCSKNLKFSVRPTCNTHHLEVEQRKKEHVMDVCDSDTTEGPVGRVLHTNATNASPEGAVRLVPPEVAAEVTQAALLVSERGQRQLLVGGGAARQGRHGARDGQRREAVEDAHREAHGQFRRK